MGRDVWKLSAREQTVGDDVSGIIVGFRLKAQWDITRPIASQTVTLQPAVGCDASRAPRSTAHRDPGRHFVEYAAISERRGHSMRRHRGEEPPGGAPDGRA